MKSMPTPLFSARNDQTWMVRCCCWIAIASIYMPLDVSGAESPLASIAPTNLTCEYLRDPLAVSTSQPRLSWQLSPTDCAAHGSRQTAYQIRAASNQPLLKDGTADLWDTGRVESSETLHVPYAGKELASGMPCYWQMRIWDEHNKPSAWSKTASWRVGLLLPGDWRGAWIGASDDNALPTANQYYRRELRITGKCADGLIYVASLGYHEVYVNGQRLGEAVLAPAISDPLHRVRYIAYEATPHLREGENILSIALGAGWTLYNGHGWSEAAVAQWPKRPALRVQGNFRDADGREMAELHSDETWKTHAADLQPLRRWRFQDFSGERRSAEPLEAKWVQLDFDDASWSPAELRKEHVPTLLAPQEVEPNRIGPAIHASNINQTAPGVYHVTMDRMFTGFVDVRLTGRAGSRVTLEVSDRADVPCVYGQQQELTLDATGRGTFRNQFNYACGQWITIRGDIDTPTLRDVNAQMVSTDMQRTGQFRCSDPFHTRLYETSLHTIECLNLGGYVVDCAHRERLGYGGDGQVTAMAMLPNYACGAFYTKWLRDWCDMQQVDGNLPFSAPTYGGGGGPAWSGFLVHESADLYERYADKQILRDCLPHVRRWLEFLNTHTVDNQLVRYDGPADYVQHEWSFLGDWVYPGHVQAPNQDDPMTDFLNNCYYAWTLRRSAAIADVLGETAERATWRERAEKVSAATHEKYWDTARNRYTIDRQANLALALIAEITPKQLVAALEDQFVNSIAVTNNHVDTGIGGTLFLLRALQNIDRPDLAFQMANQRDFPGWGKMLDEGATAIWEQWDGQHSRCHSSYLGIGGWYLESIAGIQHDPAQPGYSHILFKPGIVDGLDWADGQIDSPRGTIKSAWRLDGDRIILAISLPPNTSGTLSIPSSCKKLVQVRNTTTEELCEVQSIELADRKSLLHLPSGRFRITLFSRSE